MSPASGIRACPADAFIRIQLPCSPGLSFKRIGPSLTKAARSSWLKTHSSNAWKGYPVFEGDIFWHRLKKEYYVITFDLPHGFQLKNTATGTYDLDWSFDLVTRRGNLWSPPKALSADIVQRYHKQRATECRVERLALDA